MAWTSPRTWTASDTITDVLLNAQLRDNLNETAPAKVTTAGDILVGTGANALKRLGIGTALQTLRVNAAGNDLEWGTILSSDTPTAEAIGTTGAIGTATTTARADHAHAMPTAGDVLSAIKTVDGAGSGLDADTVDNTHASELGSKVIALAQADSVWTTTSVTSGNTSLSAYSGAGVVTTNYKILWDAAFVGGRSVYFETLVKANGDTVNVGLRNDAGTVYGQVSTTASTTQRLRSGALSLPDATELYLCMWVGNATATGTFYAARLVVL